MLLKDSWKAVEGMNQKDLTRTKLVDVVRDYHNDVCTDGSTCMVYEYKEKADKPKLHYNITICNRQLTELTKAHIVKYI